MPVVVNSKFSPFTYDELIKPVQEAAQAHTAMEEQYNAFADNADVVMASLNPETDGDLIAIYNQYRDNLNAAADNLMRSGVSSDAFNNVSSLRRAYMHDIQPIKQGVDAKAADVKAWKEQVAKDKTLLGNDPRFNSVSEYMNGKTPDGFSLSGKDIETNMKAQGAAASSRYIKDPKFRELFGQYIEVGSEHGYNSEEAAAIAQNIAAADPTLFSIMQNTLKAYGVNNLNSNTDKKRAMNYALSGLMQGLTGDYKTQYLQNLGLKYSGSGSSSKKGGSGSGEDIVDPTQYYTSGADHMNQDGVDADRKENIKNAASLRYKLTGKHPEISFDMSEDEALAAINKTYKMSNGFDASAGIHNMKYNGKIYAYSVSYDSNGNISIETDKKLPENITKQFKSYAEAYNDIKSTYSAKEAGFIQDFIKERGITSDTMEKEFNNLITLVGHLDNDYRLMYDLSGTMRNDIDDLLSRDDVRNMLTNRDGKKISKKDIDNLLKANSYTLVYNPYLNKSGLRYKDKDDKIHIVYVPENILTLNGTNYGYEFAKVRSQFLKDSNTNAYNKGLNRVFGMAYGYDTMTLPGPSGTSSAITQKPIL